MKTPRKTLLGKKIQLSEDLYGFVASSQTSSSKLHGELVCDLKTRLKFMIRLADLPFLAKNIVGYN